MALPWSFVSKIHKFQATKLQINAQIANHKCQIALFNSATQMLAPRERLFFLFGILNFGHCYLPALLNKS